MTDEQYDPTSLEGVPQAGVERLAQNRAGLYTSDLSVNEFLLVKRGRGSIRSGWSSAARFTTSAYRWPAGARVGDDRAVAGDVSRARELAMTRMEEEADQLGADGVVGRATGHRALRVGQDMAEFIAIGTAIAHREGVLHRAPNGHPFTSDLSGQDFWTLMQTGHRPVGMVMGSCVYHVAHQRHVPIHDARRGATSSCPISRRRCTTPASWRWAACRQRRRTSQAEGIVGVQLQERSHGWGSHIIEFFAVGTAIVPSEEGAGTSIQAPTAVLDLRD